MRIPRLKLIVIFLVLAGVAAGGYYSATRPVAVETVEIVKGTVRFFVEEEARTRVVDRYVVSAPVSGRLERLEFEEGQHVSKGQVVARIDPLSLESRVEESLARIQALRLQMKGADRKRPKPDELTRAGLREKSAEEALVVSKRQRDEAQAAHEQAQREVTRARDLFGKGTIPTAQKEDAELAEKRARASLAARERLVQIRELDIKVAKLDTRILKESKKDVDWEEAYYRAQIEEVNAGLVVIRDDLQRTDIPAPADGVILKRFHESETTLASGAPILEIGDIHRLEVEADFLSEDVARMRKGMPVEVFGRSLDEDVGGRVKRVYPSAFEKISSLGVEQQRVTVVAELDAPIPHHGDRYRVDLRVIFEARPGVLLIPESALFHSGGEWRTFRLGDGEVELVTVKTGLRGRRVREVLEGLGEGDRVVVHPSSDLEDGTRAKEREAD